MDCLNAFCEICCNDENQTVEMDCKHKICLECFKIAVVPKEICPFCKQMVNQILLENKILNISEFEKPKEKEQDFFEESHFELVNEQFFDEDLRILIINLNRANQFMMRSIRQTDSQFNLKCYITIRVFYIRVDKQFKIYQQFRNVLRNQQSQYLFEFDLIKQLGSSIILELQRCLQYLKYGRQLLIYNLKEIQEEQEKKIKTMIKLIINQFYFEQFIIINTLNMQSESDMSEYDEKKFVLPKSTKDLKACQQCGMILTVEQWNREVECPNSCNTSQTKLFSGMICVLKPSQSWVMRKLGNPRSIHPGLYAIDVQAD